ncbi:hypothetical protein LCGC14_2421020, partial [marine sediment metagenome]
GFQKTKQHKKTTKNISRDANESFHRFVIRIEKK